MAGNLVKWWKHKILGGYKQFSVQECPTDSEELVQNHQIRASSSCSAPPDLLLVSDRENSISYPSNGRQNFQQNDQHLNVNFKETTGIINSNYGGGNSGGNAGNSGGNGGSVGGNSGGNVGIGVGNGFGVINNSGGPDYIEIYQNINSTKDPTTKTKDLLTLSSSIVGGGGGATNNNTKLNKLKTKHLINKTNELLLNLESTADDFKDLTSKNHSNEKHNQQVGFQCKETKDEKMHFEEFTCDVSVEGGKSSKPLQFSFTFYDLDGHHGKITKDDIVGIVYTIYESIGKSVVVPHCGSKTINVRLTFSPESKSKAKTKLMPPGPPTITNSTNEYNSQNSRSINPMKTSNHNHSHGHNHGHNNRRQHRYRPRRLLQSDDEEDENDDNNDVNDVDDGDEDNAEIALVDSDKEKEIHHNIAFNNRRTKSNNNNYNHHYNNKNKSLSKTSSSLVQNKKNSFNDDYTEVPTTTGTGTASVSLSNTQQISQSITENYYDSLPLENLNLKCCNSTKEESSSILIDNCIKCKTNLKDNNTINIKSNISKVKILRKTRKTKHNLDNYPEIRQRSLSVGNEISYKNRHLLQHYPHYQHQHQLHQTTTQNQQPTTTNLTNKINQIYLKPDDYIIDGVQLRNPQKLNPEHHQQQQTNMNHHHHRSQMKRNTTECWKTAFNRNDLISIIRESMEKNRLCFQLNEKPQANVTPIRQQSQKRSSLPIQNSKLKSSGVSKIPTLIANHNNISSTLTNTNFISKTNLDNHHAYNDNQSSNGSLYHHLQPHIPIYHQQMAINPAVLAAQNNMIGHSKINPCGYDSFLHATICGGNNNHNHNSNTNTNSINNNNNNNNNNQSTTTPPPVVPPAVPPVPISNNQQSQAAPRLSSSSIAAVTLSLKHVATKQNQQQQPIATVQPIISVPNTTTTNININSNSTTNTNTTINNPLQNGENGKILNPTSHQIKLSKILRSGSYTQNYHNPNHNQQQHHHHQQQQQNQNHLNSFNSNLSGKQNSPQYRGYQRLQTQHSSNKHNLNSLINSKNNSTQQQSLTHLDKRFHHHHHHDHNNPDREKLNSSSSKVVVKPLKTYENLVYAKLREDLQESGGLNNLPSSSTSSLLLSKQNDKEASSSDKYRKNKFDRKAYYLTLKTKNHQNNSALQILNTTEKVTDYLTMLNMNCTNDPLECENLLGQTTDEETMSELNTPQEDNGKLSILESEETLPTPTTATTSTTITTNTSEALIDLNDDDDDEIDDEDENDDHLDLEELETPEDLVLDINDQHLHQNHLKTPHHNPNNECIHQNHDHDHVGVDEEEEMEEADLDLDLDDDDDDLDEDDEEDVVVVDDDLDEDDEDDEEDDDEDDDHTEIAAINTSNHMSPTNSKAALITSTTTNNNNNNSNNLNSTSNTSTSSLIHRCVHEHIHHHYHHFEKKDE